MEKVMPESLDAQSSMSGTAPAEKAQMILPYPPSSSDYRENVSIQEVGARVSPFCATVALISNDKQKSSTQKPEDKYEQIRQTLHAALPSQQDANLLLGALRPFMYLQTLCNPYSFMFQGDLQSPSTFATLPDETSHPVLLARHNHRSHRLCGWSQLQCLYTQQLLFWHRSSAGPSQPFVEPERLQRLCHDRLWYIYKRLLFSR